MVLYWTGPLQLLLRFLIGGPFISETSVGGRFGVYIYITLLGLSIFAITKNIDKFHRYRSYILYYSLAVIFIIISQFFIIYYIINFNK